MFGGATGSRCERQTPSLAIVRRDTGRRCGILRDGERSRLLRLSPAPAAGLASEDFAGNTPSLSIGYKRGVNTTSFADPGAGLVLGTTNAGKVRELVALLAPHGIACRSIREVAGAVEVEETGATFAENAALKAVAQARALRAWVLAEDSGLVVPALDGAPGVLSARFSGPAPAGATEPTDERNNTLLLERMAGLAGQGRAAHYACHAALADPSGRVVAVSAGACHGVIAPSRRGAGGFGYDPLFVVPEYWRTFGEIAPAVKAVISHRARALRAILPAILRALGIVPDGAGRDVSRRLP